MDITTYVVVDHHDQAVSEEYSSEREAVNDAQDRNALGKGYFAVVQYTYEFAESELHWTPNDERRWPPVEDQTARDVAFRDITGFDGNFRFKCPTGLCNHYFVPSELVPGESVMCPECGSMLAVSSNVKWNHPDENAS